MKRALLFVVVAILLLPLVLSFDCSSVSEEDYCEEIQESNLTEKDLIYSTLLYQTPIYPDHEFIDEYNQNVNFNGPSDESTTTTSSYIRNVWLSFSYLTPSVYENNFLLTPEEVEASSHYNYWVYVPSNYYAWWYPNDNSYGDCRTTHSLTQNQANLQYYINGTPQSNPLQITEDSTIESILTITTEIEQKHYWWWKPCKYCTAVCRYEYSSQLTDTVTLSQEKEITLVNASPSVEVEITNQYQGTTQGEIVTENVSAYTITFPESTLKQQEITYSVTFEQQPHHIAILQVHETPATYVNNLVLDDQTFYVKNINTCVINAHNNFEEIEEDCGLIPISEDLAPYEPGQQDISLSVLWYILPFCLLIFLLYKVGSSQFKKMMPFLILILAILPTPVLADDCTISNIADCLPDVLMEYILNFINMPIAPLLTLVETLLTADVSISLFESLWSIMRYIISIFYLFFILYAGVVLVVSNASPIRRAHAKEMLQNGIFMIILIQGSFYIYDLLITLGANMSSALLTQVDPTFFMLTIDSMTNIGLQFAFGFLYGFTLVFTVLLLSLRYIAVSIGIVFFPLGIFLYFIPPLKSFGKIILSVLGILIFVTFFDILIILASSLLLDLALFTDFKILVMITCFGTICATLLFAFIYSIKEATTTGLRASIGKASQYIAYLFI
jgi:hypothetical protein